MRVLISSFLNCSSQQNSTRRSDGVSAISPVAVIVALTLALSSPLRADSVEIRKEFPDSFDYGNPIYKFSLQKLNSMAGSGKAISMLPCCGVREVVVDEKLMEALRLALIDELRDPSSAEFRNLRMATSDTEVIVVACGLINAKNGFGAYVGYQPFLAYFVSPYANTDQGGGAWIGYPGISQVCLDLKIG